MLKFLKILLSSALLMVFISSCGVKTAPYPASSTLPNKVTNLKETLDENANIWLSWQAPKINMLGRPLKSLKGFQIEVSENTLNEGYCETCPHKFEKIDFVLANTPAPGLDIYPGIYNWQKQLKTNYVYKFRVTAVSQRNSAHPKSYEVVDVWVLPAPSSSISLQASVQEEGLFLTWENPSNNMGLNLEIQKQNLEGNWQNIKEIKPNTNNYLDVQVKYENNYSYRGRLVKIKNTTIIPGPWSNIVNLKMKDIIPPPAPAYLDIALKENTSMLKWAIVQASDFGGYFVYRKLENENSFKKLNQESLKTNSFTDNMNLSPNQSAFYKVTAVDTSPQNNESAPSEIVEVWRDLEIEVLEKPEP